MLNIASRPSLGKERGCQLDSRDLILEAQVGFVPRVAAKYWCVELCVSTSVPLRL
jgi:hypothetical protein